jgi:hypothetical protein
VVSFTPRPLYLGGKSLRYSLDRRLGGPQSRSGRRGEEIILDPTGTRTPTSRSPARSQSLYTLRYPGSPISVIPILILSAHPRLGASDSLLALRVPNEEFTRISSICLPVSVLNSGWCCEGVTAGIEPKAESAHSTLSCPQMQ